VPAGNYGLSVGGSSVGEIQAAMDPDGTIRGEIEFRVPVEPGKALLNFDPCGGEIQVFDGADVVLQRTFSTS